MTGTASPAWWRSPRALPGSVDAAGLARRIEAFFVRHRRRIWMLQAAMAVAFVLLLLVPPFVAGPEDPAAPIGGLRDAALSLVWGLWFPLVFLSVIVTGRSWCGLLCPMGAASEWANRIGPRWPIPRWMRWPGTPIASFVLVTVWAQTTGARDHVEALAIVFGTTAAAAVAVGFLFGRRKRAWCRHMCPIGLLLGVYSRIGAVEFRPNRPRPGGDRWTERTPCPTMVDLDHKTESRHCIECFRCTSGKDQGKVSLRLRRPGAEVAGVRDHHPNLSEIMFLFVGTGVALGGFLWLTLDSYQVLRRTIGEWIIDREWFWLGEPGPLWLMAVYPAEREVFRWLDFFLIAGYMLAWVGIVTAVLSGLTAAAAWLAGRSGGDATFRARLVELGYQFLPVAMVSLLLGIGGELFHVLEWIGIGAADVALIKGALFAGGCAWSLWLGARLLARQGVPASRQWLPLVPGALGSLALGFAWYVAIFA